MRLDSEPSASRAEPSVRMEQIVERCREAGILENFEPPVLECVAAIERAHKTSHWKREQRRSLRMKVLRAVEV